MIALCCECCRMEVEREPALLPVPRQQRVQLVRLGPPGDDTLEHVGQPRHRIDPVQLAGLDERHRQGPMTCPTVAAREKSVFRVKTLGLSARSTTFVSISIRPSARNATKPGQCRIA